ncbi:hypothetical protein QQP08_026419 [Theobroma cacao]|nr:hypothetical protein QQP08_026419 [Theobroma cacao]
MATGFKHLGLGLGLLVLLLSLNLHLHRLPALAHNSLVADLNQEKNVRETIVPKNLSLSVKLGDKHEIKAVERRGGAVAAHGGGGDPANGAGDAAGDNGRETKSPDTQSRGGAINHNRYHHHGSSSGTFNCIGSSCLVLTLLTTFFLEFSI